MTDGTMNPLTPDEALYAFMDGELELPDEQRLFDALAGNPELRTEMKDILSIRGAVHRDQLFPSPSVETGILAAAGLTPVGAAIGGAGAAAVSASAPWWEGLQSLVYTAGGLVAGALVMFSVMSTTPSDKGSDLASGGGAVPPSQQQPVITGAPQQQPEPVIARVDTVYIRRVIVPVEQPAAPVLATAAPDVQQDEAAQSTAADPAMMIGSSPSVDPLSASRSIVARDIYTEAPYGSAASQGLLSSDRVSPRSSTLPISFGFRTLASGLDASEPTPESVTSTLLPNTAFSLTIPLSEQHRVGVEMGTESFVQNFSGFDGYRQAEWTQTPVLFWIGATYQFSSINFEILPGLQPFAMATVGAAFSQGPIGRGTIGLAYQPAGPVRFTVGLDGSALFYTFQNSWFTSTKWGLSYGLSIDLGAWR